MVKGSEDDSISLSTRYLTTTLILIATAIPRGFRGPRLSLHWQWIDALVNVVLYIPFGTTFAEAGLSSLLLRAVLLSGAIESAQLFFTDRFSQPSDVIANVMGAYLGMTLGLTLRTPAKIELTWRTVAIAATGAFVWIVICPALSVDFQPLFMRPTGIVEKVMGNRGSAYSIVGTIGALATTGVPANTAFVALLTSVTLSPLLSRKNRLRNIVVTATAGLAANLLLIPSSPETRPWCVAVALIVSMSSTIAALRSAKVPISIPHSISPNRTETIQ